MDPSVDDGARYRGKKILLGISGGISAYKTCEAIRHFVKNGAEVRAVMTRAACEFITPLSVETLSNHKVTTELFPPYDPFSEPTGTVHIHLAQWPDALLIAPATANIIAKMAHGIADDMLSTITLACRRPTILAPAMNDGMWTNPIVQENVQKLRTHGVRFVEPEFGFLAEGYEGIGRLADLERIYWETEKVLLGDDAFRGRKILVTAGPTREFIDPVRVLTNLSSGRMGYAIAREAVLRGAEVVLVSGPSHLTPPPDVKFVTVTSADDMAARVAELAEACDAVVMAAAVADFRPARTEAQKIKKAHVASQLELVPTTDILARLGGKKGRRVLVGFALETEDLVERATAKLKDKHLDILVANNPREPGAGFETDTNAVTLIDGQGAERLPLMSKDAVARILLERIRQKLT
jgi:phosphopantothenoylcysteine decarboxylase/phosphopantothenate--cysteine ligase